MTSSSESAPGSSFPYPSARWLLAVLGLALVYTALGGLIIRGFGSVQVMNLFWPPQGIALAVILLFGRNLWPGVLLGSFTGILLVGVPPWLAVLLSALNACEILLCHHLLRRVWNINLSLATTHDFLLLLLASALSSCLTALVGSTLLYLGDALVTPTFLQSFGHWWQSELLGLMLVTPLCLFWWPSPDKPPLRVKLAIECVLCLGLAFLCGQIILVGWQRPLFSTIMLDYWLIPFMIWAAVRCGRRAVSLLLLMIAVQGLVGAFSGQGYFAEDLRDAGLANLWFFIVILCGVGYTLATLLNERQQKTLELQRARKFSDDILLSMPGLFYLVDQKGRLERWNPAYHHLTGYREEELKQMSVLDMIAPKDRALITERMAHVFAEGYAETDAFLITKTGQEIPYHFTGCRTFLNNQHYLVGLGLDISARKQAEQAIQASEARYRSLFEHNLANTVIFDRDGIILMINENAAHAVNRPAAALVGRSLYDFLPPDHRDIYRKRYQSTLAGHDVGVREDCYPGPNGERWYATRLHTVCNAAGEVYGLQMVSFDITARKQLELETRANELKYRQLIENTSTFITIVDGNGIIQLVNQANADMFGLSVAELTGKSLRELDPEHAEQFIERYRHILSSGDAMTTEDAFPLPNETRWFHAHSRPMYNVDGKAVAVQVVAFDITERRNMEDALRRSEALWRFALEGAGDAIWQHDLTARHIHFNARWQEILGFPAEAGTVDLEHFIDEIHPEDQVEVMRTFESIVSGRVLSHNTEARFRCQDGGWKWILARGMVAERDSEGRPLRLVGTCTDISFFKDHQRQLEHLAHFDTLTNLPNRTLLALRLKQAMAQSLRRNQSLAVAYLDLDGFKPINDQHGHHIGDELLRILARNMSEVLREGDFLARIGGDEFVAVLTDLDQPLDCVPVLQRLLDAASQAVAVDHLPLQVSTSIGVTIYPGDGADADQLVRHADQAMYQAKQSGKNRYHLFDVAHDSAIQARHEAVGNIHRALLNSEFVLYYQPKVDMKSGLLIGVEALIRWLHPERGLIPPMEFLPIIANQGIEIELGEWVIATALAQIGAWQSLGLTLPVSVNISANHLQQGNFVERLSGLLAAHPAVSPELLELEILETGAIDDLDRVIAVMKSCQAFGIRFSIDDFGTGYSSLTYLRRLPDAMLKIDRSFVRDMLDDPSDRAIVEGVIGLANTFGRKIVAEGVETIAHGELLLQLGCQLAQGYAIAKPMPPDELARWSGEWHPDQRWRSSQD